MKRSRYYIILTCALLFLICLLTGCTENRFLKAAEAADGVQIEKEGLTQIIAFGDSYSDNGSANRISTEISDSGAAAEAFVKPGTTYWNNRYSNGITAVEVLADQLKLPLTDYATGGAKTGETNYTDWMDLMGGSGVLGQVDRFEQSLNGAQADPNAMYFIFASANDYFYFMDYNLTGRVEAVADEAVDQLKMAVRRLARLGAKKFFIVNSSDLTLVPYVITMGQEDAAAAFRDYVNTHLPEEMGRLSGLLEVTIQVFDMKKASDEIIDHAERYGLNVLDKPCQPTFPEVRNKNEEEDSYYFWDEWHYTRVVHKILGEKMYQELK